MGKIEYKHCENQKNCHTNVVTRETTVTFAFDDGTLIHANKSFLSLFGVFQMSSTFTRGTL